MKIKYVYLIAILLFAVSTSYSQSDCTIERKEVDKDSIEANLKLSGGVVLYSAIDPYLARENVTFMNGYSIGLILTLSEFFDLEGSLTFLKSNSDANTNGVISSFGLRLNLYKADFGIYIGIGISHLSSEETRNCGPYGCGPMGDPAIGYSSLVLPLGVSYKVNKILELELNSKLSVIFPEFQFDRITHTLGIIIDI